MLGRAGHLLLEGGEVGGDAGDVDGDDDDVVLAEPAAPGVDAAVSLGQGDVPFLRDKEFGFEAVESAGFIHMSIATREGSGALFL